MKIVSHWRLQEREREKKTTHYIFIPFSFRSIKCVRNKIRVEPYNLNFPTGLILQRYLTFGVYMQMFIGQVNSMVIHATPSQSNVPTRHLENVNIICTFATLRVYHLLYFIQSFLTETTTYILAHLKIWQFYCCWKIQFARTFVNRILLQYVHAYVQNVFA